MKISELIAGPACGLFYAVRSEKEALFLEEIQDIAEQADGGLQVVVLTSDHDEYVNADALTAHLARSLPDYDYYLCGPGGLLTAVRKTLRVHGVPRKQVHFERFELR